MLFLVQAAAQAETHFLNAEDHHHPQGPGMGTDGYYRISGRPFRLKKPANWLVFDRETDAGAFNDLVARAPSKEGILCIFSESVLPDSPTLILQEGMFPEATSPEKFTALIELQSRKIIQNGGTLLESPTQVEIDGVSLIRYRVGRAGGLSGRPYVHVSWCRLFEKRWVLQIEGRVLEHQADRYLPVIEEFIRDFALSVRKMEKWKELNSEFLALFQRGKTAEAAEVAGKQMVLANELFSSGDSRLSMTLENAAAVSDSQGRFSDAEKLLLQSFEMQSKFPWQDRSNIAAATGVLGEFYLRQKDYDKAEYLQRQALETWQEGHGAEDPDLWLFMNRLAHVHKAKGYYSEAEQLYRQAESKIRSIPGEHPQHLLEVLLPLADLYASLGKYSEAENRYLEAIALQEKILGREHPDLIGPLTGLAESYKGQSKYQQAEELYRRILALKQNLYGLEGLQTIDTLENLAEVCAQRDRFSEAGSFYQRALSLTQSFPKPDDAHTARLLNDLARVSMAEGNFKEAEILYQESLAMIEKALEGDHPIAAAYRFHLASFYVDHGRYDEAYPLFERMLKVRHGTGGPIDVGMRTAVENLVTLLRQHGLSAKAERIEMGLREAEKFPGDD